MICIMASGVCTDLKNRRGCGPGSQHEKFMKKNCRKTCGLCGMFSYKILNIFKIEDIRSQTFVFFVGLKIED